jgi:hypothetical protein
MVTKGRLTGLTGLVAVAGVLVAAGASSCNEDRDGTDPRCAALCEKVAACENGHRCGGGGGCLSAPADTAPCHRDCAAEVAALEAESGECRDGLAGWLECVGQLDCGFLSPLAFRFPPSSVPSVSCIGVREALACSSSGLEALAATLDDASGLLSRLEACAEAGAPAWSAVEAAVESVDRSCSVDDDCVSLYASGSCFSGCGRVASVSGEADLETRLAEIDAELCPAYTELGCQPDVPPCPPLQPACREGVCQPE